MVVEYIRYSVDTERGEAFEQAYRRAASAVQASQHCERYEDEFAVGVNLLRTTCSFGSSLRRQTLAALAEPYSHPARRTSSGWRRASSCT